MSENFKNAKKFLRELPNKPGVYCMLGAKDNVLYVGKAKNLRKRLPNYFQNELRDSKSNLLMSLHIISKVSSQFL